MNNEEAYIEGFCKAAEAAGVNPEELYKFAQEYKTDGWAPECVRNLGRKYVPWYIPSVFEDHERAYSISENSPPVNYAATDDIIRAYIRSPLIKTRLNTEPKYKAWFLAHSRALKSIAEEIAEAWKDKGDKELDRDSLSEVALPTGKIYHDTMHSLTNNLSRLKRSCPIYCR